MAYFLFRIQSPNYVRQIQSYSSVHGGPRRSRGNAPLLFPPVVAFFGAQALMRAHERDKRQEGHLGKYDSFDVTLLCKAVKSLRKNMWSRYCVL